MFKYKPKQNYFIIIIELRQEMFIKVHFVI